MSELLKQLRKWLKKPAHYFLPIVVMSSIGLFAPIGLINQLGIGQWRVEGKFYLGSAFIVSSAIVFCYYFARLIKWVLYWNHYYKLLRSGHYRLKTLTYDEKIILSGYIEKQSKTLLLNPNNGVVDGLKDANIIYPSADESMSYDFPFNIREWAWIYLQKNPNLVKITNNVSAP